MLSLGSRAGETAWRLTIDPNTRDWFNIKLDQLALSQTLLLVQCADPTPSMCRTIFLRKPWGQNHRNLPEESSSTLELCEHDCTTYAPDLYLCDKGKEVCIHFNSQQKLSTESAQEKAPTTRPPR